MTHRLSSLRARYLAAIGLPFAVTAGCERPAPRPTNGQVVTVPTAGPTTPGTDPTPPPERVTQQGACGADQLRESLCGFAPNACPPDSSGIPTPYLTRRSYFTNQTPFPFDPVLTDEWARTLGKPSPRPEPYCCYSSCTPLEVHATATLRPSPGASAASERCIPMLDTPSTQPAPGAPNCPAAVVLPGSAPGSAAEFTELRPSSEPADRRPPSWLNARCCYRVYSHGLGVGRVLRVDGEARVADLDRGSDWRQRSEQTPAAVPAAMRARLARHWQEVAALEHASIAAFSRLSLQLLAHAAPPELIARTHAAALDEIEHARIAFGFAHAYGADRTAPAALDAGTASAGDLAELALETFVDGCIEETVGAVWAAQAAERADDAAVARALGRIADDEARHAELAWRILAWALALEPAIAPKLVAALDAASPGAGGSEEPELARFGVLDARTTQAIRSEVIAEVVRPCLEALLA